MLASPLEKEVAVVGCEVTLGGGFLRLSVIFMPFEAGRDEDDEDAMAAPLLAGEEAAPCVESADGVPLR